jgi:O-antigen/teichoic acid export membrane protein
VSAKTNFYRIMLGVIGCIIALIITRDMAISMTVWLVLSVVALLTSNILVYRDFGTIELKFRWDKIMRIFVECFALFAGYFLLLYVGNAPKYAIDACMSDVDQACYNFIFMPVFAIGMFANFIFNPILVKLAHRWDENKIKVFTKIVVRQIFVIIGITLLAIAVALTIGPPILGILFNADLSGYKTDLAILMIGGGMLALVNFFAVVVTVMRFQKHLISGYIVMAVAAWLMANKVVRLYGIRGATILYTILMAVQALIFAGVTFYFIKRRGREVKTKKA